MSRESQEWLNRNVLVGNADKRGTAWHYRADLQTPVAFMVNGREVTHLGNHYDGFIPVSHVQARLFDWEPVEAPIYAVTGMRADGSEEFSPIPDKKRIYPSDDISHTFGIFSDGYVAHDFGDWLLGNVSAILSDTLNVSSAGLLKGRSVAWVEVSVPDTIGTPEGVAFRPNLLATTSLDGSIATQYRRTCTLTVCDNTLAMALSEKGQVYKRKHTRYSAGKVAQDEARAALAMVEESAEEIAQTITDLCQMPVTDKEFSRVVSTLVPIPEDTSKKMATTIAEKKRGELSKLWISDSRVEPWKGTAFGVVQAFNTWEHHIKGTRGSANVAERNMLGTITGSFQKNDAQVMDTLRKVLASA
jgi:phage/plasmid-like protein (TIGR03299 family)